MRAKNNRKNQHENGFLGFRRPKRDTSGLSGVSVETGLQDGTAQKSASIAAILADVGRKTARTSEPEKTGEDQKNPQKTTKRPLKAQTHFIDEQVSSRTDLKERRSEARTRRFIIALFILSACGTLYLAAPTIRAGFERIFPSSERQSTDAPAQNAEPMPATAP